MTKVVEGNSVPPGREGTGCQEVREEESGSEESEYLRPKFFKR